MLNISPIGRNCSPKERDAFEVSVDLFFHINGSLLPAQQVSFDGALPHSIARKPSKPGSRTRRGGPSIWVSFAISVGLF